MEQEKQIIPCAQDGEVIIRSDGTCWLKSFCQRREACPIGYDERTRLFISDPMIPIAQIPGDLRVSISFGQKACEDQQRRDQQQP